MKGKIIKNSIYVILLVVAIFGIMYWANTPSSGMRLKLHRIVYECSEKARSEYRQEYNKKLYMSIDDYPQSYIDYYSRCLTVNSAYIRSNAKRSGDDWWPDFETFPPYFIKDCFFGYECKNDCEGHEAGYDWAIDKKIKDINDCNNKSKSFMEGCIVSVNDSIGGECFIKNLLVEYPEYK